MTHPHPSPRRRTARLALTMGALTLAALALGACSSSSNGSGSAAPTGGDPGPQHIHGLGINPADGQLYAASHYGVFRIHDGNATRQGNLIQDTMGFTVAGPDLFYGSGHPDLRNDPILTEGMRPLLGLIESTDQAATWKPLSLQGDVDFHALAAAHGSVYGFDATGSRFLVSTDLENWDTRSSGLTLISIAVDPDNPDRIIAGTPDATIGSTDGGRTWNPVAGAPALWYLSWDPTNGLYGVTQDGTVHRSTDGTTFQQAGNLPGRPAALLAQPDALYAATDDTAILRSTDQGANWQTLYTP